MTLCDGLAFPVAFHPSARPDDPYRLVAYRTGSDPVRPPAQPTASPDPLPQHDWTAPLAVNPTAGKYNLTAPMAHRIALNESDAYRRFSDNHPDAIVLTTTCCLVDRSGSLQYETSRTEKRRLSAVAPSGEAFTVEVWLQTKGPGLDREGAERMDDTPYNPSYDRRPDQALSSLVDLSKARQVARDRLGTSLDFAIERPRLHDHPWGDGVTDKEGGTSMISTLWMKDPSGSQESRGGLAVSFPYQFVVEGRTGAILWYQIERGRVPG